VARELLYNNYPKVYALKGGWKDWLDAGFPSEPYKP
jgi:3-mercaptopyruvate sulfurtransferase SseA